MRIIAGKGAHTHCVLRGDDISYGVYFYDGLVLNVFVEQPLVGRGFDQYASRISGQALIRREGPTGLRGLRGLITVQNRPKNPVCGLRVERGVGWVLIDHPPKHLVDGAFMGALVAVLDRAERDDAVHVLVFESADPDFFMMHGDVEGIMRMPHNPDPATEPNPAEAIFERVRRFPKPTIGMIDGHARGGGSEFLSALDMRFAGPRTVLGQPEVPMGILPGAGGTQFLARLVGRARALEIILGGGDVYADEAAAIGYVNRVMPSAELRPFVATLAERIAAWPPDAVQAAKRTIDAGIYAAEPQFVIETNEFRSLINARSHMAPMQRFLDAGGQTREGETTRMDAIIDAMRNPDLAEPAD